MKNKVRTVMKEFKSGDLKSSSGKKVTNPKQAIAIALSEAGKSKSMKEGGHMKESKEMMKKEVSFMKKKGAPKSMIKHEMKEAGMKPKAKYMSFTEKGKPAGMKPVQMAMGGMARGMTRGMAARSVAQQQKPSPPAPPGAIFPKQLSPQQSRAAEATYKQYQQQKQLANSVGNLGSQSASNKMRGVIGPLAAAGARGMMKQGGAVKKMAGGGLSAGHKSADGVAKKGKTDTKQVAMKKGGAVKKMRYGGKC
jgi:hypothetical protein